MTGQKDLKAKRVNSGDATERFKGPGTFQS